MKTIGLIIDIFFITMIMGGFMLLAHDAVWDEINQQLLQQGDI